MFEGLKKKFSTFIDSLSKKEEEKAAEAEVEKKEEHYQHAGPAVEKKEGTVKHTHEPEPLLQKKEERAEETEIHVETAHHHPEKEIRQERQQPKVAFGTKLKGLVFKEVKISEGDVDPFIEQLKMSLLQSDVNYNAAERILEELRKELLSRPISSRQINKEITEIIRSSILRTLGTCATKDMLSLAREKKEKGELPFRILFIGPNGAGKTTTIAKVAHMLIKNGFSCVISASDTFRAAAIEQTVHHAGKLGIEAIKGKYGADPASIAFDAIAHAKATGVDVVLIDSAGRQETNKSLMEEMKKMVRVAKPDLKVFVGESITGNSLLEQVSQFNEAVGLDGIILTKLDCDAKGGNTLSILSEAKVPILYFGLGEKYDDMIPYDPNFIINNILPN